MDRASRDHRLYLLLTVQQTSKAEMRESRRTDCPVSMTPATSRESVIVELCGDLTSEFRSLAASAIPRYLREMSDDEGR